MAAMKSYANAIGLLFGVAMLAGCASSKVTEQTPMTAPGLALAGRVGAPSTPPTPGELETGRKYGAMIAQQLVKIIRTARLRETTLLFQTDIAR